MSKVWRMFLVLSLWPMAVWAQIDLGGSVDLEVSSGGKASNFLTNGISNEYRRPHLAINQLNLFASAQLDESFSFNGRLGWNTWGTGRLSELKVLLAELTWQKPEAGYGLTVGRYLNPFGLYPKRQLARDNSLVNAPLLYEYFINMSDVWGAWANAGASGLYDQTSDVGMNTVYFGGYLNGGMGFWSSSSGKLTVEAGWANAALASAKPWTNLSNGAVAARIGGQPTYFWQQGLSVSHGSFIELDNYAATITNRRFDDLEKFRQTLVGLDWVLAYSYFELSGEFVYSLWKAPAWTAQGFVVDTTTIDAANDPGDLAEFDLENSGFYVDLRYEPPFLTGSYIAVRAEQLTFKEFDHPADTNFQFPKNPWDNDVERYSVAVGYKLSRSVLLKLSYLMQETKDVPVDPEDDAFRAILTATF